MMKPFVLAITILFTTPMLWAFESQAPQAYLVDFDTGTVLYEKNADQLMVPSSMTKIMTAYMAFDRINKGEVSPTDTFKVSEKAWRKGGSKMFVKINDEVSLDNLLHGLLTQSGNDACIVVAEGLSGSEETFSEIMTEKAKELGTQNTIFLNATGWPDQGHLSSARDLALIAEKTIRDFPALYQKYYGVKEFTYNKIRQGNRNPLLYESAFEADGLKTGGTEAGGHGVVGSATKNGRRLILVINGLKSPKERVKAARELMIWGFNEFRNVKVFPANTVAEEADTWGGAETKVPLVVKEDVVITIPRQKQKDIQVKLVYEGPIPTPLQKGQEVGYISIASQGQEIKRFPLYAAKSVEKAGFFKRIGHSLHYLIWGKHSE